MRCVCVKDGSREIISGEDDILLLIERYLGYELRCFVEEFFTVNVDDYNELLHEYETTRDDAARSVMQGVKIKDHYYGAGLKIQRALQDALEILSKEPLDKAKLRRRIKSAIRTVEDNMQEIAEEFKGRDNG